MSKTKKVIFTEKQIRMIAESEMMKVNNEENVVTKEDIESLLDKDLGDEEDKKIEYPLLKLKWLSIFNIHITIKETN